MKIKKLILLLTISFGLMTLLSTTCDKDDPDNPGNCEGVASASSSGALEGTYCFVEVTSYKFQQNNYVSLFASQNGSNIGFDLRVNSLDGAALVPGTYNCGPGELGFVELIDEENGAGEFYKSKSGTLTVTQMDATNFKGSFSVVAVGYYGGESINFVGTVDATNILVE